MQETVIGVGQERNTCAGRENERREAAETHTGEDKNREIIKSEDEATGKNSLDGKGQKNEDTGRAMNEQRN